MTQIDLTDQELELVMEALDSHEYWQLSEPEYRDSGSVTDAGVTDEIRECRALEQKLAKLIMKTNA